MQENSESLNRRKQPWLKIYDELKVEALPKDDRPVAALIADTARSHPDAPALLFFDKVISYSEYDRYVSKLANVLKGQGIGKGDVVGMLMPNIPQYAFAFGACSRLGAIGTGLSPLSSPPELAYQIGDAKAKVVIALSDLAPKLSGMSDVPPSLSSVIVTAATDHLMPSSLDLPEIANVDVIAYNDLMSAASDQCEQTPVGPHDIFMIQYTGGTTGRPKGAQLSVRNFVRNPRLNCALLTPLEHGKEIFGTPFPLFHIAGLYGLTTCLCYGGLFYLIPNPREVSLFIKYMQAFPPSWVGAVPALIEMLLATPEFTQLDFSNLDTWASGAAPISSATVKELCDLIGEEKLSDAFGMTETTATYVTNPPKHYKFGSVGIPALETDLRIMDVETGKIEMPLGEAGEICASGPQVMKGYINLPEETANALREIDGRTYMYSGDVGYMDEDGFLFLCDRAKDMLIVGGFKVFSVEIEDKLSSLPMVESSAVVGSPDEARPGNDIVHLFVQLTAQHKDRDHEELRSELMDYFAANMAVFKKPKAIHFIEAIPLTPIGKINKKELRASLTSA